MSDEVDKKEEEVSEEIDELMLAHDLDEDEAEKVQELLDKGLDEDEALEMVDEL